MSEMEKITFWEKLKSFHPIMRMFDNRLATMIFSVVIAVIIWFVISITIYPTTPVTVNNIPLVVDLKGTAAEADGYSMINCDVDQVSVKIEGSRSKVGTLNAENLIAYADIPNITTAGTKNLNIVVKSTDGTEFTVKSITPQSVNVRFDKIRTVTLDVLPDISNIESAEGCIINKENITVTPATIDVTGPAQVVGQIKNALVMVDSASEIGASAKVVSNKLQFSDANGSNIIVDEKSGVEYDQIQYTVDIPVQYTKEMDITYQLRGVPSTFNEEFLRKRLMLSADKVTLAAPDQSLANREEFTLDTIPLSSITIDFSKNYSLEAPEGYENLSNISTVNLTLDSTGLAQKDFVVNEINIINAPSSHTYSVVTGQLIVTIVGNEKSLEQLDPNQISVTVDLLSVQQGDDDSSSFSCVPTISIDKYDDLWAAGDYKVIVNASKTKAEDDN